MKFSFYGHRQTPARHKKPPDLSVWRFFYLSSSNSCNICSISRIMVLTGTLRCFASFIIELSDGLRSPRSTIPMNVLSKPHKNASSSCDSPRAFLSLRMISPNVVSGVKQTPPLTIVSEETRLFYRLFSS